MPLQATSGAASYDAFGGGVPSEPNYIESCFSTYLYTGNGSTQTITNGIDLAGEGGLVWIKKRDAAAFHILSDTARGVYNYLKSNTTEAEINNTGYITSYNSNGFSIGGGGNINYDNLVSWTFREQPKFFDVVTWSGNNANPRVISHNLGSVPGSMFIKATSTTGDWFVYHRSFDGSLRLNTTAAGVGGQPWYRNDFTSTTISVTDTINATGVTYVAYLFAHNAGGFGLTGTDNVISCGSFTNGGSTVDVNLGYEAQFVLMKKSSGTGNWFLFDTMRGMSQTDFEFLYPNLSNAAEPKAYQGPYATATGFSFNPVNNGQFTSGTYIYIAIRRGPMKVPTSGTSVFEPVANTTTQVSPNVVGSLNADWFFARRITADTNWFQSSKLSPKTMPFNSTGAEDATQYVTFTNTGVKWINTWSSDATTYRSYLFQRAPSFFDEVCYTGTGTYGALKHNLGVIPEWIIGKPRSATGDWIVVYLNSPTNLRYVTLNSSSASANWGSALNTSTEFYGTDDASGTKYVHYLFATCAGVSKVGSYTGNGSSQTINCGFTGGARFVMVKATSTTGNWIVADSARGIVAGNDPALYLNSTAAEVTGLDWIDADNSGFVVNETATIAANTNGVSYIFFAVA